MTNKYSLNERAMFAAIGLGHLLDAPIDEMGLYRIAIDKCFRENLSGPYVECLRRAANFISNCKVYRMTPEFDSAILPQSNYEIHRKIHR